MDFLLQSNALNVSRRCGRVESGSLAEPLMTAFHDYHEQCGRQHQQFSRDTGFFHETQNQTDDGDDDGCTHDDVEVRHTVKGNSERKGPDTLRNLAADDRGCPISRLTSRKHDYSVAELLRNDQPSSSDAFSDQTLVGLSDSRRHSEAETSPLNTADSAFQSWNVEQTDRPLLPPFILSTSHHRRWTEWMTPSDSWQHPESNNNAAQQRCFSLFDTSPVNFIPAYRPSRRGRDFQLPLSTFGTYSYTLHRSNKVINCQSICAFIIISYSSQS